MPSYKLLESFRPLIGVNFCKLFNAYMEANPLVCTVSVPLSGLTSVNDGGDTVNVSSGLSFRPLIGVNFCKPYPLQTLMNQGSQGALACLKFNNRFWPKFLQLMLLEVL